MQEIKCPKCGEVFTVDESGYAAIVKQVRDKEFEKELEERNSSAVKLAEMEAKSRFDEEMRKKDDEINLLRSQIESENAAKKLAVSDAESKKDKVISDKDKAIAELCARLEANESEKKLAVNEAVAERDSVIQSLKARIGSMASESELAVRNAVAEKDKELSKQRETIATLGGRIEAEAKNAELKERAIKEKYEEKLRDKDEQIAYYKDLKARQSTKMVGETLEQHCEIEFNRLRATGFRNAYFEKDNDARTGSKGDYIFREASEDGTEFISIMFEMKNEMSETATKHKNEDFFKELDKDRNEKGCEYAVLVSLLEADSELYNSGIVDVSYRYPKMYVIRPQFFIPMITLLRNAALNTLSYRKQLAQIQNQNIDISHFEADMNDFKDKFSRNYRIASEKFAKAIEEIDKTIDHLQKTKDALLSSENNLRLANNKAEELSIKRLTRNNPTMAEKFAALNATSPDSEG